MTVPAYPLPDSVIPDSYFCAKVFIPDRPEYRRAFLGAYFHLSKWVAWERDRDGRGAIAASYWREAIDMTMDIWESGCEDSGDCDGCEVCEMTEEELENLIKGVLEDMTIQINQTVNCGCGCGDSACNSTVVDEENMPPDGYDVEDSEGYEPPAIVLDSDKCNRLGYLLVSYRNSCLTAIQQLNSGYDKFNDWFDGIVGWLVGYVPLSYDVYVRMKEWLGGMVSSDTDDFIAGFDPNFEEMLCIAFSSDTAADAKAGVRQVLEDYVWSGVNPFARLAYKELYEQMPFDMAFDASVAADIPPGYENRSCCGSVPVDSIDGLSMVVKKGAVFFLEGGEVPKVDGRIDVEVGQVYVHQSVDVVADFASEMEGIFSLGNDETHVSFEIVEVTGWATSSSGSSMRMSDCTRDSTSTMQVTDDSVPPPLGVNDLVKFATYGDMYDSWSIKWRVVGLGCGG